MNFSVVPMTEEQASAIATWRYEGMYAFYDWDADPEDLDELSDPSKRGDRYHAVLDDEGSLVGFFEFTSEGPTVELGLGLRPDLTGRGLGLKFVSAGLQFARERYAPATFRLKVATFNHRAIRVYERAGFQRRRNFRHRTNNAEFDFVEMGRPA